MAEPSLT